MRRLILCVLACALAAGAQTDEKRINYAVMPLRSTDGVTEGEAALITDRFRIELFNTGLVNLMEREQMQEVLTEQGFQQSGACSDDACIIEMGQLLGVECMISGSVGRLGTSLIMLNMRIIDVRTGTIKKAVAKDIRGEIGDVVTHLADLSRELLSEKQASVTKPHVPATGAASPAKPAPAVASEAIPVNQPVVSTRNKSSAFLNRIGLELSSGTILIDDEWEETGPLAPNVELLLCMRLMKFVSLEAGIFFQAIESAQESVSSHISYRRVPQPGQTFDNGRLTITASDNAMGFVTSAGVAFDIGRRLSLSASCAIKSLPYKLRGELDLPDIGASVPDNVYGDDSHTMVLICPRVSMELFMLPKLSLILGGGASLGEELLEYSPGYREWADQWIINQPEEKEIFSLSGLEFSLGLRWYWR